MNSEVEVVAGFKTPDNGARIALGPCRPGDHLSFEVAA